MTLAIGIITDQYFLLCADRCVRDITTQQDYDFSKIYYNKNKTIFIAVAGIVKYHQNYLNFIENCEEDDPNTCIKFIEKHIIETCNSSEIDHTQMYNSSIIIYKDMCGIFHITLFNFIKGVPNSINQINYIGEKDSHLMHIGIDLFTIAPELLLYLKHLSNVINHSREEDINLLIVNIGNIFKIVNKKWGKAHGVSEEFDLVYRSLTNEKIYIC